MFFAKKQHLHRSIMEQLITHAKEQFDQILSYVQCKAQSQQLHEVEKGIFSSLLKIGLTLLMVFFQAKGFGNKDKQHINKEGFRRPYHSIKSRMYRSIFGKINIRRACYWAKGKSEIYPLDAELNLPNTENSYLLQEWGAVLGAEESYEKTARFLETILGTSLWGSSIESIIKETNTNVSRFYQAQPKPENEEELLVATIDGKGIVMRKDQLKQIPKMKRIRKVGEKEKKKERLGKKKMSTVIGVYTIAPHKRTAEELLEKKDRKKEMPHPKNKVIRATMQSKDIAAQWLKVEVDKRNPEGRKSGVALVDGEHKLRELIKTYLPGMTIIIDLYHVMEHLWRGAHIFHQQNGPKAEHWAKEKLTMLLHGKIEELISELKTTLRSLSSGRKKRLQQVITYLENGKEHLRYDIYLSKGYPIGSGVVEGACRNLVKDRMEQSGMHWTLDGAEAMLGVRSIQINKMSKIYWRYHIDQEKKRLYEEIIERNTEEMVA